MANCYYFGCVGGPGHYFYGPDGRSLYGDEYRAHACPWREHEIDARLQPHRTGCDKRAYCGCGSMPEGQAVIHHKDGWTALSFWDRSVDGRSGCNSNFFIEGTYEFSAMLQLAREKFPSILARFTFEIAEYKPEVR